LSLKKGPGEDLLQTSGQTLLLQHLSLLFVPAGVGIIVHLSRVADEWQALLAALVVSTFVSMAVTALVMKALARKPAVSGHGSAS
jgi:holin-like protein